MNAKRRLAAEVKRRAAQGISTALVGEGPQQRVVQRLIEDKHLRRKAALWVAAPTIGLAVGVIGAVFLIMLVMLPAQESDPAGAQPCGQMAPTGDTAGLTAEQADTAAGILKAATDLHVPQRGAIIAIATALQESGLRPINYGDNAADGSSRGPFQQLAAWGPLEERIDPYRSALLFFNGGHAGQPGLLAVAGWQQMELWRAAQSVQHAAYPNEYAKHEQQATQIVAAMAGGLTSGACGTGTGPVVIVGDSITLGSADSIRAVLTGRAVTIDAVVGRTPDQGEPVINNAAPALTGSTLVVALCTNYGGGLGWYTAYITRVMGTASLADAVVWVTCTERTPAQVAANQAIRAAATVDNRVRVAEWAAPSTQPGVLGPDGIHPTVEGRKVFAQVIASALPAGADMTGGYALPLPRTSIHPPLPAHHDGGMAVDIPAPTGTPIFAIEGGTVSYIGDACGLGIQIAGPTGVWLYCHASERTALPGDTVATGMPIGKVGSTGESTGPHLHVQVQVGVGRCPQPFLDALYAGQPVAPASLPLSPPCA